MMSYIRNHQIVLLLLLSLNGHQLLHAFLPATDQSNLGSSRWKHSHSISSLFAKRYGPPSEEINLDEATGSSDIYSQFTSLLHEVMSAKEEELPSILTTNISLILSAMSTEDLIENVIREETSTSLSHYYLQEVSETVDMIITFAESFVEHTSHMESVYKKLLGKIFKLITPAENNQIESEEHSDFKLLKADKLECELDRILAEEKEAFTPGFLRHLEGECDRIGNGHVMTPESTRMLQILRVIQTRVLEELGKVRMFSVMANGSFDSCRL